MPVGRERLAQAEASRPVPAREDRGHVTRGAVAIRNRRSTARRPRARAWARPTPEATPARDFVPVVPASAATDLLRPAARSGCRPSAAGYRAIRTQPPSYRARSLRLSALDPGSEAWTRIGRAVVTRHLERGDLESAAPPRPFARDPSGLERPVRGSAQRSGHAVRVAVATRAPCLRIAHDPASRRPTPAPRRVRAARRGGAHGAVRDGSDGTSVISQSRKQSGGGPQHQCAGRGPGPHRPPRARASSVRSGGRRRLSGSRASSHPRRCSLVSRGGSSVVAGRLRRGPGLIRDPRRCAPARHDPRPPGAPGGSSAPCRSEWIPAMQHGHHAR